MEDTGRACNQDVEGIFVKLHVILRIWIAARQSIIAFCLICFAVGNIMWAVQQQHNLLAVPQRKESREKENALVQCNAGLQQKTLIIHTATTASLETTAKNLSSACCWFSLAMACCCTQRLILLLLPWESGTDVNLLPSTCRTQSALCHMLKTCRVMFLFHARLQALCAW